MAKINLLPWREERRQELKKEFFIFSGGFALLAIVVVMAWQMYLSAEISNQQARIASWPCSRHITSLL